MLSLFAPCCSCKESCADPWLQEPMHQAGTTLGLLSRFRGRYRAALLAETTLLPSLVDCHATLPSHGPLVDISMAIVNMCDTDSAAMQQQVSP